jgi:hypothetical protein
MVYRVDLIVPKKCREGRIGILLCNPRGEANHTISCIVGL